MAREKSNKTGTQSIELCQQNERARRGLKESKSSLKASFRKMNRLEIITFLRCHLGNEERVDWWTVYLVSGFHILWRNMLGNEYQNLESTLFTD